MGLYPILVLERSREVWSSTLLPPSHLGENVPRPYDILEGVDNALLTEFPRRLHCKKDHSHPRIETRGFFPVSCYNNSHKRPT